MMFLDQQVDRREGDDEVRRDMEFEKLHGLPLLLPSDEVRSSVITVVAFVAVIAAFNVIITTALRLFVLGGRSNKKTHVDCDEEEAATVVIRTREMSVQITHLFTNLFLGLAGLYAVCFHVVVVDDGDSAYYSVMDKVAGMEEFKIFGEMQLAYQLWSIPAGIYLRPEPPTMLIHHVSALTLSSVATFLRCGWRFFIPFFFGLVEISSVPLACVNAIRSDPQLRTMFPTGEAFAKVAFSAAFLTVRVYMWLPRIVSFLDLIMGMTTTCQTLVCTGTLGIVTICAIFLTVLQLFWAIKIVRGLAGMAGIRITLPDTSMGGSCSRNKTVKNA